MARVTIPGVAHHVTQRGNNRQTVFLTDGDRRLYLKLLGEEAQRHSVSILAYYLMDTHVHLIVMPERADSLARGLGRTHFRYARAFNRHHRRSGHLWQNRFFSCLLEGDHFWRALRYVERNPVQARLSRRAWTYPWSSAAAHCGLIEVDGGVLDMAEWAELARERDWQVELTWREAQEEMETLRSHTQTGRPLTSERFLEVLERQVGRRLRALPVGRPVKKRREREIGDCPLFPPFSQARFLWFSAKMPAILLLFLTAAGGFALGLLVALLVRSGVKSK